MQNGKSKKKYYGIVGAVTFAALFSIFINEASSEAKKKIQPKKITAEASVQMTKGEKETLSYQVRPKKTTNKKVTFSSSNKKIVTVSKTGALQAKSEGTATITIRSKAKKQIKNKCGGTEEDSKDTSGHSTENNAAANGGADGIGRTGNECLVCQYFNHKDYIGPHLYQVGGRRK